jgi:hypothetical protein
MLPENNQKDKSLQSRKLNLEAKYESLVIVPQDPTEKSCVPPCDNCVCNSESQNSDDVPPLEEDHSSPLKEHPPSPLKQDPTSPLKQDENQEISKENLTEKEFERENNEQLEEKEELKEKQNKNTNLEESINNKELKKQKECIIV